MWRHKDVNQSNVRMSRWRAVVADVSYRIICRVGKPRTKLPIDVSEPSCINKKGGRVRVDYQEGFWTFLTHPRLMG